MSLISVLSGMSAAAFLRSPTGFMAPETCVILILFLLCLRCAFEIFPWFRLPISKCLCSLKFPLSPLYYFPVVLAFHIAPSKLSKILAQSSNDSAFDSKTFMEIMRFIISINLSGFSSLIIPGMMRATFTSAGYLLIILYCFIFQSQLRVISAKLDRVNSLVVAALNLFKEGAAALTGSNHHTVAVLRKNGAAKRILFSILIAE